MINPTWDEFLYSEFDKPYFREMSKFLHEAYETKTIYPPKREVFSSFINCDLDKVKVVIIGQDPYHQPGQACGMCFAVKPGVPLPPSLVNIYREISDDLHVPMSNNGYLLRWERQGVLLLNSVLTVEESKPNSHRQIGWMTFTDNVLKLLNSQDQPMVFMLWGNNAKSKQALLDNPKHLILTAAHPSPLSAYNGFFGCRHFSKANAYLKQHGLTEIDWRM